MSRLNPAAPVKSAIHVSNPPSPRDARMQAGNQVAGHTAAELAMEQAATKQYTAAWQWVYQPSAGKMPGRGTPAYIACLSVAALRQAEKMRKQGNTEEVERLKDAALQWRRALMYPMMITVIGKNMPEYTDAPAGFSIETAAEIVSVPDLSSPFYQGGLVVQSINRGTRVVCLYPTVS